jgi:NAD(P)H-dependent FMN reductase
MGRFSIPVIVGSTRRERQTPKAARYVHRCLSDRDGVDSELLDLLEYDFPMMEERLRQRDDPPRGLTDFSKHISEADGLIIVSPEYNSGYPGVLKNALDYLLPEYRRKPVGIVTVSAGSLGGTSCLAQLRQVVLSLGAVPLPAKLPVTQVRSSFEEDGTPIDPAYEKRATRFIDELLWFTEALSARRALDET